MWFSSAESEEVRIYFHFLFLPKTLKGDGLCLHMQGALFRCEAYYEPFIDLTMYSAFTEQGWESSAEQ